MKPDAQFVNDFLQSSQYVNLVAYWFSVNGISSRILPNMLRPEVGRRFDFMDNGDIEIHLKVEVKHRSIDFTSRDDYPYPTILIDEVYKVDKKSRDLYAYVILNERADTCIMIYKYTISKWRKVEKRDRTAGEARMFYEVPKEFGIFMRLELEK